ncbi:hypothetical protein KRIGEM_02501 [Komagataeibacter rhaeticus]|nr:hypothetical protein KRIGEM_02501 [Komagataeibacter rhaeticus]
MHACAIQWRDRAGFPPASPPQMTGDQSIAPPAPKSNTKGRPAYFAAGGRETGLALPCAACHWRSASRVLLTWPLGESAL